MSNSRVIDPGVSFKIYDILDCNVGKIKSRSSNIVSALSTNQSIPQTIINDEFVKRNKIPSYDIHQREIKRQRQIERSQTKGKNWYHMPAPEMTDEKKNDLIAIQMRGGLYADKFFKKGTDIKGLPKYFQTGTIVDNPADFYRRIPKKNRKKTILEELYNDTKVKKFSKKRYAEIKETNRRRIAAVKHMKRLKNKKK